jgi:hypothetical protein
MQEEKIETFLTQIRSLDALALSIVEELKLCKLKNEMLTTEKVKLEEEIRLLRAENAQLQDTQQEATPEASKPKPKKTKSKAVEPDAPTLF